MPRSYPYRRLSSLKAGLPNTHFIERWGLMGVLMALGSPGCLMDAIRGPELGECAITPDGVYSWGDIDIGTCLAGPVDVRFIEQDGRTLLAVANADPYRNFKTGSVLLIDYDAIDLTVPRNFIHELPTWPLPISDDDDGDGKTETAMLGQIGVLGDGRLLVPGRLTEEGTAQPSFQGQLRAGRDELYVLETDLDGFSSQTPTVLTLRDDPFGVVIDDASGLAYVGNLTDHSLSVMSTDGAIELIDVATTASISDRQFIDVSPFDASLVRPTVAELVETRIIVPEIVPDDRWTLTYVEGTQRIYQPHADGITRYTGSQGALIEAQTGPDISPSFVGNTALDPFLYEIEGLPVALFAETSETGSSIRRAISQGTAADWNNEGVPLLIGNPDGPDRVLAGPALAAINGQEVLFYDGRESLDDDACIYATVTEDGVTFSAVGAAIVGGLSCPDAILATDYDEVAQPYVRFDSLANLYRMWMSARIGDQWVVALTESEDGETWSEPRTIMEAPSGSIGAPTVSYETDHYRITVAVQDPGTQWFTAQATGFDGVHWTEPTVVIPTPIDVPDSGRPPRSGALVAPTASWRFEGRDFGLVDVRAVSGIGNIIVLPGFAMAIASGHEMSNSAVPSSWARGALRPSTVVDVAGVPTLFATATESGGRSHAVALQEVGDTWSVVEPFDAIDDALATPGTEASAPVVVRDPNGTGYVMFYGHTRSGRTRIRRATSPDGRVWTSETTYLITSGEESGWDVNQIPHSVEIIGGSITLWYTGDDTSRFRIGAATASSLTDSFTAAPGEFDPWRFAPGIAGSFDDSGVKDPLLVTIDGERHLYYSGFDGDKWHLGHAVANADGDFDRRVDVEDLSVPSHSGLPATFSAQGVEDPTLMQTDDDQLHLLISGFDGFSNRVGAAQVLLDTPQVIYPAQRRATANDTLSFSTTRGGDGISVIELAQEVDAFISDGVGMSDVLLDNDRGMIYVSSKLTSGIFAIDIRDDSAGSFVDANAFDIEAVFRPVGGSAAMGFRGLAISPDRGLLYATASNPDGLWVFDLDKLVDDDIKNDQYAVPVAVLPLPDNSRDAGQRSQARIGGAGMALAGPDDSLLLVTHFRDNSLFVFDLDQGVVGEQTAYIPFLGENPHIVRVAPDGLTAVVANYTGDVYDKLTSATLVIIDLDPESETYLKPLTWIANR